VTELKSEDILNVGRGVINDEKNALKETALALGASFVKAVRLIAMAKGRLAVLGIGKSGHIGRKISATMASTGTPSFFVHPTEALHGDLGMITKDDVVLGLSFSGETEEISKIIAPLKKNKVKIVSMTGNRRSNLARMSDVHIEIRVDREACPYNLAPTASTTAMLAVGDALSVALMKIKNFDKSDFAAFHPGGSLGKLLTSKVRDIMPKGKNPRVPLDAAVKEALFAMTKSRSGAVAVVDGRGVLKGYFTDGDLRRLLQKNGDVMNLKISGVMTKKPFALAADMSAARAAKIINDKKIDNAPVLGKSGKVIGFLDIDNLIEFIAPLGKK
jgi:arabinose-5-phosphate isomerase